MLLEGTSLYFWLLFLIFLIVYITVKICLGSLFVKMRDKAWRGYVPFYATYILVQKFNLKPLIFYMTLIPFVNLYYYNIIIKKLLQAFAQNEKDSIWYIILPMYKFPELVFKNPVYIEKNNYELTNEFIAAQNALFNTPKEELPEEINLVDVNKTLEQNTDGMVINPSNFEQNLETTNKINELQTKSENNPNEIGTYINTESENIYTTPTSEEESNNVTYVEAKEETKEEKPTITPLNQGKEKICPKCGTRLAPGATTCFMCGTVLE
ncbi:MAG: zinc ribbon domain-containing protein [Bacilli bacterium]|nr:zinc ribbon domain-containing protein [Bacilli bacterium]